MDSSSLLPIDQVNRPFASFMKTQPSQDMIRYVAHHLTNLLPIDELQPLPTPPLTPGSGTSFREHQSRRVVQTPRYMPGLEEWVERIVDSPHTRLQYTVPVLLGVLVYVERLSQVIQGLVGASTPKSRAQSALMAIIGKIDTRHRVFLAAFMIASKYLNDAPPKNYQWRQSANPYNICDIMTMELQLMTALRYNFHFTEHEMMKHAYLFMPGGSLDHEARILHTRQSAVRRVNKAAAARSPPRMPLTPPHDAVPPTMQQLAKQLEDANLAVAEYTRGVVASATNRQTMYSSESVASVPALTDDNGSSSSSDSSPEETKRRFVLRPVPASARRKVSAPARPVPVRSDSESSASPTSPSREFAPLAGKYSGLSVRGSRSAQLRSVSARHSRAGSTPMPASGSSASLLGRTKESMSTRFLSKMWGGARALTSQARVAQPGEAILPLTLPISYEVAYEPEYEYGIAHGGQA